MEPIAFKITANGNNITDALRNRLLRLVVSDTAGIDSDTVSIELDNRDHVIKLPETGASLDVWIGYGDNLVFKGTYEVDELEVPLDDCVFSIHAKAVSMKGSLKAPKDRTFDNVTLGQLLTQAAEIHGYEAKISPELESITFDHIDQKSESDLSLLNRLAQESGGFFKPVANKLVIALKGEGKSVSGQTLPEVTISDAANTSGRVTIQKRSDYQSVIAHWFDEDNQVEVEVIAGSGEPQYKIQRNYPDAVQAQQAVDAKLKGFKRGQASIEFSRPLTPSISPETTLIFENHHSCINKKWLIESVEHTIESNNVASTSGRAITPNQ